MAYMCDRNRLGGGLIVHVRNDIPNQQLIKRKFPGDIEGVFVEVNLRNIKWLIFGAYTPVSISIIFL